MYRKRESVVGALVLCLVLLGPIPSQAQSQGVPARIAHLQAQLNQALATIGQLQAALSAETSARQAADTSLESSLGSMSGGGVSQAALDAAIAGEASARSAGDAALQNAVDSEAAARTAFDDTLAALSALAPYVKVDAGTINDLAACHLHRGECARPERSFLRQLVRAEWPRQPGPGLQRAVRPELPGRTRRVAQRRRGSESPIQLRRRAHRGRLEPARQ